MEYLFILLAIFIGMLLLMQLIFFEISRKKMLKAGNIQWFLALDKPFSYHRAGFIIFICVLCYIFSGGEDMFTLEWFLFLILFVAMGVVADAVVQYLTSIYSKKRSHKQIQEALLLENELLEISQTMTQDSSYEESPQQYDEGQILKQYLTPQDHLAVISIDQGKFVSELDSLPEVTYIVEPYGESSTTEAKFIDKPVKVTKLTSSGQLPFKDSKMDLVLCEYTNYDKFEVQRVLKNNGYLIINQRGTSHLKELSAMYMPFGMKGSWDAYSCADTLQGIGLKIVDKMDDYGTIRFHSIQAIHSYFMETSPDFANINKYKIFYLKALKDIKDKSFFEMSTHRFYVIAQKLAYA